MGKHSKLPKVITDVLSDSEYHEDTQEVVKDSLNLIMLDILVSFFPVKYIIYKLKNN